MDTETNKKPGTLIDADDLEVGQYLCVHSCKMHDDCVPIMGRALKIKAICLPYIVGQLMCGSSVTLDCRYLNFMRVTDEFVKAQV